MRILPLLLFFIFIHTAIAHGQTVPSSCTAPDSVKVLYRYDAERLAVAKFYRNDLAFKDSIRIPVLHTDTALNALLAVYNAALPARDTVVDLFSIHRQSIFSLKKFHVSADSSLSWMQQLKIGSIPSGNTALDQALISYGFHIYQYDDLGHNFPWHEVIFATDTSYNTSALMSTLQNIAGIQYIEPGSDLSTKNRQITDSIYTDHVELVYMHGWGDCAAGCIYKHYWKFNVWFDCSVTFAGSYGDALNPSLNIPVIPAPGTAISPNPFIDHVNTGNKCSYQICNMAGQPLLSGTTEDGLIDKLGILPPGLYLLFTTTDKHQSASKIIKQ